MKKILMVLITAVVLASTTGCAVIYEYQSTKAGVTRHEMGLLGLPTWMDQSHSDSVPHGLLPIYITTEKDLK